MIKKNCNNCRALESYSSGNRQRCTLGHSIDVAKTWHGIALSYKPKEECEKPLALGKFMDAMAARQERLQAERKAI